MRSVVFISVTSALVAVALSSVAQPAPPGSSTASFGDAPAPAPSPGAPAPAPTPPAATPPSPPAPAPASPPASAPPSAAPTAPAAAPVTPSAPPAEAPSAAPPPGAFDAAMAVPPVRTDTAPSTAPRLEPIWPPKLVQAPGFLGGLEGYGGLLALGGADTREAYAFAGGQLRVRYDFYEAGTWYEVSDGGKAKTDGFSSFGGFIGAWLPYRGWVDFEIAASVGARTWKSDDPRYGADGYSVTSPTLGLRVGVSDRTSSYSAFAARIGGQIVFAYDLSGSEEPWELTRESNGVPVTDTGVTKVGGFSAALALVIGFDYGKAITPSPAASEPPK